MWCIKPKCIINNFEKVIGLSWGGGGGMGLQGYTTWLSLYGKEFNFYGKVNV